MISASYDPTENKLRLRSTTRLDTETYARVKTAGFRWAPKQELFVAPAWSPEREDLLLELCGEIGDEDTSLVDRAEDRAERFDGYAESRADDAESAHASVAAITEHIPLGQPILVGHHSEKRARKDAQRIESGMRKAVQLWETAQYWVRRAEGAVRHAKYKELPAVRHRRIKGLAADRRRMEARVLEAEYFRSAWERETVITKERAMQIANFDTGSLTGNWFKLDHDEITPEFAKEQAIASHARTIANSNRWILHLDNRLAYERAMLGEIGGLPVAKFDLRVGGRVLLDRGEWATVVRLNRKDGQIVSVTTNARYVRVRGVEDVRDYRAPEVGDAELVAAATKKAQLCNYPADGHIAMTAAEWAKTAADFKCVRRQSATETRGAHRVRMRLRAATGGLAIVYLSDAKRVEPPAPDIGNASAELPPPVRDAVCTNPPFADGQDIAHILHALTFLKPGGKIVALCANGPRQNAKLRRIVVANGGTWEELDSDAFTESGTHVRAVLLTMRTPSIGPTIFECRCCDRSCRGLNDGTFLEPGWRRIDSIDGPNAICPSCQSRPDDALASRRADGYTNAAGAS